MDRVLRTPFRMSVAGIVRTHPIDLIEHDRYEEMGLGREVAVQGGDSDTREFRHLVHLDPFELLVGGECGGSGKYPDKPGMLLGGTRFRGLARFGDSRHRRPFLVPPPSAVVSMAPTVRNEQQNLFVEWGCTFPESTLPIRRCRPVLAVSASESTGHGAATVSGATRTQVADEGYPAAFAIPLSCACRAPRRTTMSQQFQGRVALVTGTARGQGRARTRR